MFFGIAVFSFLNCRNSAVGMIKEIGTNSCYYPKHFIILKSRMKKLFKIKDRVIPRYLYFELLLSLFFLLLGPVNTLICIALGYPAAYILAQTKMKYSSTIVMLFILPMWVNVLVRTLATVALFDFVDIPLGETALLFGMVVHH